MSFPATPLEPSITGLDIVEWKETKVCEHMVISLSENIAVLKCCIMLLLIAMATKKKMLL